ncbi:MAG: FHA domain-containing protein [Acidobacteria bacterium]|nr:FHA domain-containing protein [Acidobacteriota bacterium]
MPELVKKKGIESVIQGILTRSGSVIDKLTGRGWRPSSSLATSELADKLRLLLDEHATTGTGGRRVVPHFIELRMQWDKFSTDAEESIKKLTDELTVAAIDHINDRHYYTAAPLSVQVRPDYFTSGVRLVVSFEKFDPEEGERAATIVGEENVVAVDGDSEALETPSQTATLVMTISIDGSTSTKRAAISSGSRLSIGRTGENDIALGHTSVSKFHAALVCDAEMNLSIADTGSTNGTFVNGSRISYGKATAVKPGDELGFGSVKATISLLDKPVENKPVASEAPAVTEAFSLETGVEQKT